MLTEVLDKEDSDRDGVIDIDDFCPKTPKGVTVDEFGCPIDTDLDGVADYKDTEPETHNPIRMLRCSLQCNG